MGRKLCRTCMNHPLGATAPREKKAMVRDGGDTARWTSCSILSRIPTQRMYCARRVVVVVVVVVAKRRSRRGVPETQFVRKLAGTARISHSLIPCTILLHRSLRPPHPDNISDSTMNCPVCRSPGFDAYSRFAHRQYRLTVWQRSSLCSAGGPW